MKTTKELYKVVEKEILVNYFFINYKYRKKDRNFIKKRKDGFCAVELQVQDYYDLIRDGRAMQICPIYFVRFDVLHKWFEKYSFKTIADQRNNSIIMFSGENYYKKREHYFMLNEIEFEEDLHRFIEEISLNAKQFEKQFDSLQSVYDYLIPPILKAEKELPDGQADWIFEYLTLCRIVAPQNYETLKKMIYNRIEFILSRKIKDINILYYYPNLDTILMDMENQFPG